MSSPSHDEPGLFDLPLGSPALPPETAADDAAGEPGEPPAAPRTPARRTRRPASERAESLPLFADDEFELYEPEYDDTPEPAAAPPQRPERSSSSRPRPTAVPRTNPTPTAGVVARLRATCGDLAVLGAIAAIAVTGARALGIAPSLRAVPGLLLFLLAWSFLYFVVSLAFWGQTPGMAWAGLVARSGETEPLSFGQTARRWAGTWLTWALAGLPGLLALSGRSLADRLSGSRTYELEPLEAA